MAKELRPYTLQQAQEQIREAQSRMEARHNLWRALETLYHTGDLVAAERVAAGHLEDMVPGFDRDVANLVLPHINVIIASVVARDPKFIAVPYGGGELAEVSAKLAEAVVDFYWKRSGTTAALKEATRDAVVTGNGFLKVGWSHVEREMEDSLEEMEEQLVDLLEGDRELADLEGGDLTDPDELVDALQLTSTLVEADEPYGTYVSPYDIFVPPNAREMRDVRWVAHRITLPVDEIEANDEFNRAAVKDLKRDGNFSHHNDRDVAEWKRRHRDDPTYGPSETVDTATLYEFYDMRKRRLMVLQLDAEKPLYNDDLPYSHRYPPFAHIRNYRVSGSEFWGFGDLENVSQLQRMMNEMLTEQMDNARRAGNRYFMAEDLATETVRTALASDLAEIVVPVDLPQDRELKDLIVPVPRQPLPADIYEAELTLEGLIQRVIGINDFQAGGVGADRMSATAAAVVDGIASLRAMDKVASVEEGAAHAANLMLLLCQEFLDMPRVIRVAGMKGAAWPEVTRADIQGEYLVSIEGGSTKAVNLATREQRGARLLQEIMPILTTLGYDPTPTLRSGLRDMGFDPDQLLIPKPEPEPMVPDEELASTDQAELPAGAPADVTGVGGPPSSAQAQAAGDIAL